MSLYFQLIESLLWKPETGYFLLNEHLQRLEKAADFFKFTLSLSNIDQALQKLSNSLESSKQKVRLTVSQTGTITLKAESIENSLFAVGSLVGIAAEPIDRQNPFLYHKTTNRTAYTLALASQPQCRDVFLWNEDGVVTESAIANIIIQTPAGLITPSVECGLLPGTFRQHLLKQGKITEGIITLDALRNAETVFLINSVRGWIKLEKVEAADLWKVDKIRGIL